MRASAPRNEASRSSAHLLWDRVLRWKNEIVPGRPQRVFRFHVDAWDVDCPQYIPRLFTEQQVERGLRDRIADLEARLTVDVLPPGKNSPTGETVLLGRGCYLRRASVVPFCLTSTVPNR